MDVARRLQGVAVAMVVVLACALSAWGGERFGIHRRRAKPPGPSYVAGEVIVKFKPGTQGGAIADVDRRHGTSEIRKSRFSSFRIVRVPKGKTVEQIVAALGKEASVEYAEPNSLCHAFSTPDDPLYFRQWHLDDTAFPNPYGGANGGGINVEPAWDATQGAGVVVAVIDTGVAHEDYGQYKQAPDLAGTSFVPGYDFVNNDAHPNDDNAHGTHVAGTIAQSTNNGLGVAGVAYGCAIMPVKVLDASGSGTAADLADGIHYAADHGAQVINMSLGWSVSRKGAYDPGPTVRDAVAYAYGKGVTIVCAAGNDGARYVAYPAAYDAYCIAVGATRYDEKTTSYSNYGSSLDLVAPGGDVGVDQNGDGYGDGILQNTFNPNTGNVADFGYWFFDGTSMATPHVAGVAALVISRYHAASGSYPSPDQVRDILQSTAEDKGPSGWDSHYGYGIVDAAAAVGAAGPPLPPALGTIAGTVTNAIAGTPIAGATVSADSGQSATTAADGTYSLADVPAGSYNVTAAAAGFVSQTQTATVTQGATATVDFALAPVPPAGTVSVVSIDYAVTNGRRHTKDLTITVALEDGAGKPVRRATVSIDVTFDGQSFGSGTGTTGRSGTITFLIRNAPAGTYVTKVTSVAAGDLVWDGTTPPNSYTLH